VPYQAVKNFAKTLKYKLNEEDKRSEWMFSDNRDLYVDRMGVALLENRRGSTRRAQTSPRKLFPIHFSDPNIELC